MSLPMIIGLAESMRACAWKKKTFENSVYHFFTGSPAPWPRPVWNNLYETVNSKFNAKFVYSNLCDLLPPPASGKRESIWNIR